MHDSLLSGLDGSLGTGTQPAHDGSVSRGKPPGSSGDEDSPGQLSAGSSVGSLLSRVLSDSRSRTAGSFHDYGNARRIHDKPRLTPRPGTSVSKATETCE